MYSIRVKRLRVKGQRKLDRNITNNVITKNKLMNAKYQSFEDLLIWKESMRNCVEIYRLFKECRDFGFKDQIQRAAVSVPSNISEGYERQTDKEFIQFLFIAKGSNAELRTQLYLAIELGYVEKKSGLEFVENTRKISGMIQGLIKVRKENIIKIKNGEKVK